MAEISVVKKDGHLETFQPEKIARACMSAGAPKETAEKIAEEVQRSAYDRIPTSEVRRMVLDRLKAESPAAAEAFEKYTKTA